MSAMFGGCASLATIYCNDDWSKGQVEAGENRFMGCTMLNGTQADFDDAKTGIEMANPTTGYFTR